MKRGMAKGSIPDQLERSDPEDKVHRGCCAAKSIEVLCRELDKFIFTFISPLAGLFFIDIGDIAISIDREPEAAQVMIRCRLCNFMYSQACAEKTLLTEEPEIVAKIFFQNMIKAMGDLCVRQGIEEAHGFNGIGNI